MKIILHYVQRLLCFLFIALSISSHAQKLKDTTITVYFNSNEYLFNATETARLDSFFSKPQNITIKNISGYTDTVGSEKSNLILSHKRNESVINFLKKNFSIQNNFIVNDFGETNPISQTDNALNRRVEIALQLKIVSPDTAVVQQESTLIKKIVLDKLYFKPDEAILESFSSDYLKRIAAILKTYTNEKFEIHGHVNCPLSVPPNSDFMKKMNELSENRAKEVFEILKENGIPAEKMTYKGMGNTQMIYPHAATDDEKRKNMRVEIFIINNN